MDSLDSGLACIHVVAYTKASVWALERLSAPGPQGLNSALLLDAIIKNLKILTYDDEGAETKSSHCQHGCFAMNPPVAVKTELAILFCIAYFYI